MARAKSPYDHADTFMKLWEAECSHLSQPEREVMFAKEIKRKWRSDFLWVKEKLIVEIDGGQWVPGGGRHNTDKDREKINTAVLLGYRVIRLSTDMLRKDPMGCIELVVRVLEQK